MPPAVASLVCCAVILGLFWLDRDRSVRTSPALWLAVVWVSIGASRMVSQWFGVSGSAETVDQYLDGSPVDRLLLTILLIAGLIVLIRRGRGVGAVLRANGPILVFVAYCALSTLWADYPFVAFKRWNKALGNLVMVLIVLTDQNPSAALKRFMARIGFVLIPISVLLIKYYPEWGRGYDRWLGTAYNTGIATEKNSLGAICLVAGLGCLWRVIVLLRKKSDSHRPLVAQGILLAMVLWLLWIADSATSLFCFILGGTLIALVTRSGVGSGAGRPATIHLTLGAIALAGLFMFLFLDTDAKAVQVLGRDTTLTGRTDLWQELLQMNTMPILGTGFESFFLGARAEYLWDKYWWKPNQAHNGYLEVYLNLGWVGVGLLILLITSGYRRVITAYRHDPTAASLRLAIFAAAILYNLTEAAFKVMHPVWIAFLLAVIAPKQSDCEDDQHVRQNRLGHPAGENGKSDIAGSWPRKDDRPVRSWRSTHATNFSK